MQSSLKKFLHRMVGIAFWLPFLSHLISKTGSLFNNLSAYAYARCELESENLCSSLWAYRISTWNIRHKMPLLTYSLGWKVLFSCSWNVSFIISPTRPNFPTSLVCDLSLSPLSFLLFNFAVTQQRLKMSCIFSFFISLPQRYFVLWSFFTSVSVYVYFYLIVVQVMWVVRELPGYCFTLLCFSLF